MTDVKQSRKQRAAATRERILAAAYKLFADQGYLSTTMPEVAKAADVAVQTVYFAFRTKAALLEQVYAAAVLGPDSVRPLDSDWFRRAVKETDPGRSLATMVGGVLTVAARLAPLAATMDTIDDTDVRALWAQKEALRRELHRSYVEHLKKSGALRSGLSVDRATDLFLGLSSPALYQSMTAGHRWSHRQWAHTLTDLLAHSLLRDRSASPKDPGDTL
jgi:AcrR family transcriptional regulator